MRIALDTNCFIDATNRASRAFAAMSTILEAWRASLVQLTVSRHALAELERKPDAALDLARSAAILPHYPIGTWDDQMATWDQAEGTWDDVARHEALQERIAELARSGTSLRDRGAYVDAVAAGVSAFVTSDGQLVGSEPAKRLEAEFGVRVLTPQQLAALIESTNSNSALPADARKDARR